MYRARGDGHLLLDRGPRAPSLTALALRDEGLYLVESALFAFDEPISFENGRLTAEAAADGASGPTEAGAGAAADEPCLQAVHLHGEGSVLVEHAAPLLLVPVAAGVRTILARERLVAWSDELSARLISYASRAAVEFSGEGWVLSLAHAPEAQP